MHARRLHYEKNATVMIDIIIKIIFNADGSGVLRLRSRDQLFSGSSKDGNSGAVGAKVLTTGSR